MNNIEKQKIPVYILIAVCVVTYLMMVMAWSGLLKEPAYDSTHLTAYGVMTFLIIYVFPVACLMYAISSYIHGNIKKRGIPKVLRLFVLVISCLIALNSITYALAPLIPYEQEPGLHFGPQFGALVVAYMSAWVAIPLAFIVALSDVIMNKRT